MLYVKLNIIIFAILCIVLGFTSCKKPYYPDNNPGVNLPPVANAGKDQTITLPNVRFTLNGSGSTDPENHITGFQWSKISGPFSPADMYMVNNFAVETDAELIDQGVYQIQLMVIDDHGLSAKDTMTLTINADPDFHQWTRIGFLPYDFFNGTGGGLGSPFLMVINGKIYSGSGNTEKFWQYEPVTNTWHPKKKFPGLMTKYPAVFSLNGKGYSIGAGQCWQYDPAIDKWIQKNNPPKNFSSNVIHWTSNDKVYLVSDNNVLVYDPVADTYIQKNNFPDLEASAGFVINNEGYCIGGSGQCWNYDSSNDSWHQKASLPKGLSNISGFSLNNSGNIIGDYNKAAYNDVLKMQVWHYDPSLNKWERFPDYPGFSVSDIRTVSLNSIVYVGLGLSNGDLPAYNDFWSYRE